MTFCKYVMVVVVFTIIHTTSSKLQCRGSNNCMCANIEGNFEFQCPMDDPKVVVKIQPEFMANILCIKMNRGNWNNKDLPSIEVGKVQHIEFVQCPLPTNTFFSIMDILGINSTKVLKFSYSEDFENVTLTSDYFEGISDLERLILNNNNIQKVDENAFQSLDKLTEIDLKSNNIQLTKGLFKYSSKLKILDLARNELVQLPSELFQNLTDLRALYLWSNHLTAVNGNIFKNLNNLHLLELSRNSLQDLAEDAFYSLGNLKKLSLSENLLQSVPENLLMNNKLLELFNINRNVNITLPENLFQNLTKLKEILITECQLTYLPENLFNGLKLLDSISLQINAIEYLPNNVFKDLTELHTLDLSNNKIRDLPNNVFGSLGNLKILNLGSNMLTNLGENCFYGLEKAEMIDLSNNRIASINRQAFQPPRNLKEVILANNYFDLSESELYGASVFSYNNELENINLSNNRITTINDDLIISKVKLKTLDLRYNQISNISFMNLMTVSSSATIYLMHNNISTVDFYGADVLARSQGNQDMYSSNAANRKVYLDSNPIDCDCYIYDLVRYFDRSIDPMVPTLVTIKANNLTCNSPVYLKDIPVKKLRRKWLSCSLEQLGVISGCPENCSCMFRPLDKSLIISCIGENLTQPPELVLPTENFYNQTEVHLQNNFLTSGPKENMGYENVTKLYLSSNNISKITWVPPKIEVLELHNNNISSLSYTVLTMLNVSSLTNITLGDNPWTCDCSNVNLTTFLVCILATKEIDANNIKCKISGKLLVHLSVNDLCPTYTALILGLSLSCTLVILFIAIVMVLYYRHEHEIKVWLFAHSMCLWFVTEEEIDKDKIFDAFLCFSHKDEDFVVNQLMPVLEQGPQPYKLCVHTRDWVTGEFIAKQIVKSVEDSRRTVVILSPHFLESEWGIMEFRTAYKQGMSEKRPRVIVILYGDVDVNGEIHPDLKAYIKTNTYVKWGDPNFWDKLRYALPHSPAGTVGNRSMKNQNIMISLNDKLNLINGAPMTPNPGSTPPAINIDPLLLKTSPLNFTPGEKLTPPAESGLNPLLITSNK